MFPHHIIHFNDPEELKIIINGIFNLKNPLGSYEKCIYWVLWIVKWEELHKKRKIIGKLIQLTCPFKR